MRIVLVAFLIIVLIPASAHGLAAPNVTFIPARFSAGSPFIAVATGASLDSRITWIAPGSEGGFGQFPRVGNLSYCYFSDTDPLANCGPPPFKNPALSPYDFLLGAVNSQGQLSNNTLLVQLGGIEIFKDISIENGSVYFEIDTTGLPTRVEYSVYSQNISLFRGTQQLNKNLVTRKWIGEISLPPGTYYISLIASSDTDFGGELIKVTMPGFVPGVGGSCPDIPGAVSGYPLLAEPAYSRGILISPGETWDKTGLRLDNIGPANVTNLTVRVPSDLSQILEISLPRTYLEPNDTVFYTVRLRNIRSSTTINALVDLLSAGNEVGKIQVNISVTVMGEIQSCPSSGKVSISPGVFGGNYLIGDIEERFSISNNENSEITGINYSKSGSISSIASVSGPARIAASGTVTMTVTVQPTASGNYQGSITVQTSSGNVVLPVNINVFQDVSSSLVSLRSEYEGVRGNLSNAQLSYLSGVISGIETDLDSAETLAGQEKYLEAEKKFAEAQAGVDVLSSLSGSSGPPSGGGPSLGFDFTTIIIIAIAIAIVGVAFLFMKKRKKGISDDLDQEFEAVMKL